MKKFTTALLFMLAFCAGMRAQDCSPGLPPYYLDFESASLPSLPECTTGDAGWTTAAAPGFGFDDNTLQYTGTSEAADAWFFTKGIQLTAGQGYKISFKYGNNVDSANGQLQVAYGTGADSGSMTSIVTSLNSITGASASISSLGPIYIGVTGTYYFGFHAMSEADQGNLMLDDIVIEPWTCNTVNGVSVTDITDTSANISWDAVTDGNTVQFYQYCFVLGTGDGTAGPTTGATTGSSSYITLVPGTTYTAYVRTFCSGTWGDWVGSTFTTTGCAPVTNLTVSDITYTSANISWDAVTGGTMVYFYQYYFAEEGNDPSDGPATGANSASSTSFMPLNPGTNYTAFVRTFCSGGVWGDWVSVNFSTLSCNTVSGLQATSTSADAITLSWDAVSGTVQSYTYAFSETDDIDTAIVDTTTDTSASFSGLTPGNTYYFWVKTNCSDDYSSDWTSVNKTLDYCIPQPYSQDGIGITNFTLGAINNTTGSEVGYYGDYTAYTAEISQGVTKNFSITYGTGYSYGTKIWIDWNNDYDFDDDGEQVYYALSAWTNPATLSGTITVPIDASLGAHRLRIGGTDEDSGPYDACYIGSYGSFEDYTLIVTEAPSCFTPSALTGIGYADGTALLSWTAPEYGDAPVGYEYVVSTSSAVPTGSGTPVTDTLVTYTGITTATNYYFFVRTDCGGGSYGDWVTSPVFSYILGDTCQSAINLDEQTSPYSNITTGMNNNFTPSCPYMSTAPDMYLSVTVPAGYTVTMSQTNNFDSTVSVFYGSCNALTQISCFDDPDETIVEWTNTTGISQTLYWIEDGYASAAGSFVLSWSLTAPACYDWTGATSSDWNTSGNWCSGVVPTSTVDVTIPATGNNPVITSGIAYVHNLTVGAGATLTVNTGATLSVDNILSVNPAATLTIQDNAALVQGEGTETNINSGSITFHKQSNPLFRLDYTLWSSPVDDQTLYNFSPATATTRFYEYKYDYTGTEYANLYWPISSATAFTPAKGYLIRMPNVLTTNVTGTTNGGTTTPEEYSAGTGNYYYDGVFTGAPHNGTVTYPLGTTGNRYTAVGNPYPSPINIVEFFSANNSVIDLSSGIYLWRKRNNSANSSYATLSLSGFVANPAEGGGANMADFFTGNNSDWTLAPGQGFFVRTQEGLSSAVITFTNGMRTPAPGSSQGFFKSGGDTASRFWLNIAAENGTLCQTMVAYMDNGTLGLDYGYDAKKFTDANSVAFYSVAQQTPLAIQARPEFETTDVVPMGFVAPTAGSFTVTLDHADGVFADGQKIYLRDNQEGIIHNMSNSYTFSSEAGTFEGRFDVIYTTEALGANNPELNNNKVIVYTEDGVVGINSGTSTMNNVTIYDLRGRRLFAQNGINNTQLKISNLTAEKQVLIVEIDTVNGKISKRIVF